MSSTIEVPVPGQARPGQATPVSPLNCWLVLGLVSLPVLVPAPEDVQYAGPPGVPHVSHSLTLSLLTSSLPHGGPQTEQLRARPAR